MRRVTIDVDEWVLQEAAAALDTTTIDDTIKRALAVATEALRGERMGRRQARLAPRGGGTGRRRRSR